MTSQHDHRSAHSPDLPKPVTFRDPLDGLTTSQQAVLDAVRRLDGEPDSAGTIARMAKTSPSAAGRALRELQARGLTEPAIPVRPPIWWQHISETDAESGAEVANGQRWYHTAWRGQTFIEITSARRNQFGCWSGRRVDADDARTDLWVPERLLAVQYELDTATRTVTEWSAQFFCPVHGQCGVEMVRTDKTCALCGSLLDRAASAH